MQPTRSTEVERCSPSPPRWGSRHARLTVLPWATLTLLGAAVPLHAQTGNSPVGLSVCNKGTIPVEVVAAEKTEPFVGVTKLYYNIRGKSVAPGKCAQVHFSTIGQPAYIGFGFYDALGRWWSEGSPM